jgi:hypothetical protein
MGMLDYVIHRTNETRERIRQRVISGDIPKWITNSKRLRYIAQVIISTPKWVDRDELKAIKYRAQCITEMTGIEHHVCHKTPLNHPRICGLTVPWNLEIKPARINLHESNHVLPDEQLALF